VPVASKRVRRGSLAALLAASLLLSLMPTAARGLSPEMLVTFDRPLPAVTGSPYTIRPVYPDGFVIPVGAKCAWRLRWGDDGSLFERKYNETYGRVDFEVSAADGGCEEWTFTLPYGPSLQYQFEFSICEPTSATGWWCFFGMSDESLEGVFQASLGTTDRHIWESNLPVAYILPSAFTSTVGVPITYTLFGSENYTPPVTSTTWMATCVCHIGLGPTKTGGSTFTFTPDKAGTWKVEWSVFGSAGTYNRNASFDPPVFGPDSSRPTTTAPSTWITPWRPFTSGAPTRISWTGKDIGSGISRYQLQRSVDAGAWTAVALTPATPTSVNAGLVFGHTYRFRVRAIDRAGNVGSWTYGPVLRPRAVDQTTSAATWSGTWATRSSADYWGGTARWSTVPGVSSTYTFTGRAVSWVASRGPDRGQAAVYIDGVLAGTVDLNAPTSIARHTVFSKNWSAVGTHRIQIRPLGTAGRPRVEVDAFLTIG
jgi:hypothetical protein